MDCSCKNLLIILLLVFWSSRVEVACESLTHKSFENSADAYASCTDEIQRMSEMQKLQLTIATWTKQLKQENYMVAIPPSYPHETNVSIQARPNSISGVNEFDHTVRLTTVLRLSWKDERLAWQHRNVCDFPYRNKISVLFANTNSETQSIWLPLIFMHGRQEVASNNFLKICELYLHSDGRVDMLTYFHEVRMCSIQTRRFPFDVQTCPLKLEAFQYVSLQHDQAESVKYALNITDRFRNHPEMLQDGYETNEWRIYATDDHINAALTQPDAKHNSNASTIITYPVYLTRRSSQHVINWILSPIVLSISSAIGMYRGCEVGERFGYGGTIVVTITLMSHELRTVLGISADGFPILCQMYIGLELTLILATLISGIPQRHSNRIMCEKRKRCGLKVSAIHLQNQKNPDAEKQQHLYDKEVFSTIVKRWNKLTDNWDCDTYEKAFMFFVLALQACVVGTAAALWVWS